MRWYGVKGVRISLSQLKIRSDLPSIAMVRKVSPLCSCSSAHNMIPYHYVVCDTKYAANGIIRPEKCDHGRNIILTVLGRTTPINVKKTKWCVAAIAELSMETFLI
jgi:hypothetical protein